MDSPLQVEKFVRIGTALGLLYPKGKVVIGKSPIPSGYMIEAALVAGLTFGGMYVEQTGPVPKPGLAMLTTSMRTSLGIMILTDESLIFFGANGLPLCSDKVREIECLSSDVKELYAKVSSDKDSRPITCGRAIRIGGVLERYITYIKKFLPDGFDLYNEVRIVVDAANGAASIVAPQVLEELGADVFPLNNQPNGVNIDPEDCGIRSPASLGKQVLHWRADMGIAVSADGDRVKVINAKGDLMDLSRFPQFEKSGDEFISTLQFLASLQDPSADPELVAQFRAIKAT